MKKRIKSTLIILATVITVTTLFVRAADDYFEISKNLDIFASLYREINSNYVDDTKPGELMKTGIDAMLQSLDPYTNYIPESKIEDYRFMTTGQYGGIGALIQKRGDYIIVAETYDGFPAQDEGVLIGDRIIEIDGNEVTGKSTSEISEFLKGQPDTDVKVKIQRGLGDDAKMIDKKLKRAEIKIHDVPYYGEIADGIGYIKLVGFTQTASSEFLKAFKKMKDEKEISSLIIDLRGNGGGLLIESVNIVNMFVEKGTPVVSTRGKLQEWEKQYKALNSPVDLEIPVVVLVDEYSASASEIVSGALQDLDRAVILGRETYGKGLVQQTVDLSYNSKLKVTVAKYYIPSGRCIQRLNYSDRDFEGEAKEIPDSLIKEFKSLKNGRALYDGKGIKPDIIIKERNLSNISYGMLEKFHIFDFATQYRLNNNSIEDPEKYEVGDETLIAFNEYVNSKDFSYSTNAEALLEKLKESTVDEHYYQDIESEYKQLNQKLIDVKNNDFEKHKEEIRELLGGELVIRYYHQKGQLTYSLKHDEYIHRALELLNSPDKYKAILAGTNQDQE